ncbi:MAG TPA: hypothetical protein VGI95_18820 [Caulobacteraceae bacterium]|jgi:hypothetical protein
MERSRLQAGKTTLTALALPALTALGFLGACEPPHPAAVNAAAGAPTQDYRAAPELQGGGPSGGGRIQLFGSASPGAAVRLASPGGSAQFATADATGKWRVIMPPSAAPRLLGLSMSDGGQVVQALGYLFVAPDGLVVRLRVGGGTQAPAMTKGLAPLALDFDNQRATTLSGMAGPREPVSLRVDGVERGQTTADSRGRFVLPLSQPLPAGSHDFDLVDATQEVRFSATVDAPQPLANMQYAAGRLGGGWRIDWITPGGGEQTTLILGPQPGSAG